jgi:hypothetical protein
MLAIESLCEQAILLKQGRVEVEGPAQEVVASYVHSVEQEQLPMLSVRPREKGASNVIQLLKITLHDDDGNEQSAVQADRPVTVRIHYRAHEPVEEPHFMVGFGDGRKGAFASASMLVDGECPPLVQGDGYVDCTFETLPLYPRTYEIYCGVRGRDVYDQLVRWQRVRLFEVTGPSDAGKAALSWGLKTPVRLPYRWNVDGAR